MDGRVTLVIYFNQKEGMNSMRLVSFNPYRSIGISGIQYIKPEMVFRHKEDIAEADPT